MKLFKRQTKITLQFLRLRDVEFNHVLIYFVNQIFYILGENNKINQIKKSQHQLIPFILLEMNRYKIEENAALTYSKQITIKTQFP